MNLPSKALSTPPIGERMVTSLAIFGPISSVPGSATIFIIQPLLNGKVPLATGVLIGAQLFLLLAQHFWGLECVPGFQMEAGQLQSINIPVDQLQELLRSVIKSNPGITPGRGGQPNTISGQAGALTNIPAGEAPLNIGLAISADYSNISLSPVSFLLVPIFTLPGLTGSLPFVILILLITIFVRATVPPETTGAKPAPKVKPSFTKLNLTVEDLVQILHRFGGYFQK